MCWEGVRASVPAFLFSLPWVLCGTLLCDPSWLQVGMASQPCFQFFKGRNTGLAIVTPEFLITPSVFLLAVAAAERRLVINIKGTKPSTGFFPTGSMFA